MAKRSKSLDPQDTEDLEGTDLEEQEELEIPSAPETPEPPPTDQFHGLPDAVADRLRASIAHRGQP